MTVLFRPFLVSVSFWIAWVAITVLGSAQDASVPAASQPPAAGGGEINASVGAGGLSRYVSGRWGVVSGQVVNESDQPQKTLMVVTPEGNTGLQYARSIEVPGRMVFDSTWPVRLNPLESNGTTTFEYLHYPGGDEDGVIRTRGPDAQVPTFTGITRNGPGGICAWVAESGDQAAETSIHHFIRAMRHSRTGDQLVSTVIAASISAHREGLDPLDQLTIGDSTLNRYPEACQSIRDWVRRGGRLLVALDMCGVDVARNVLGETMSLTVVGETSSNDIRLDLNPDYPGNQYPVRFVDRTFSEPVRYLRVIADAGEPVWTVDGWPVAIRVPMGEGMVLVTTIDSAVFIQPQAYDEKTPAHGLIASTRRMAEAMFAPRNVPLISEASASAHAAAMVGYEIPSQSLAGVLLTVFPLILVLAGIWLQRRVVGERLIWILPALALLAAVPALAIGSRIRSVAPTTVIESSLIHSTDDATDCVVDGFATVYSPSGMKLDASTTNGTMLEVQADATNRDYRRLLWTGPEDSRWVNLEVRTGLKTFPVRSEYQLSGKLLAEASFDEKGLRGKLLTADFAVPSEAVFAAPHPDRLSMAIQSDGSFQISTADVLTSSQYFKSSIVSEEQREQAAILDRVFHIPDRLETFPQEPVVVFWGEPKSETFSVADETVRRKRTVLFVQPLRIRPPAVGELITIPAPLISFRTVPSEDGSFSSIFDNNRRLWTTTEASGNTRLQLQIPSICHPFEIDAGEVSLSIRAASRSVSILAGSPPDLQEVASYSSPLGTKTFSLPAEALKGDGLQGKITIQLNVGSLDKALRSEDMTGEQDDSWQVERLLVTLRGRRLEEIPANVAGASR